MRIRLRIIKSKSIKILLLLVFIFWLKEKTKIKTRQQKLFKKFEPYLTSELGNYEPKRKPLKSGNGEGGKPFFLDGSYNKSIEASIAKYGFNTIVNDKISLNRSPKDLRHDECRHWNYDENIDAKIGFIFVFYNEPWSSLMRTIHSVINNTPENFLKEIILVDDSSSRHHITSVLPKFLEENRFYEKVFLHRNKKREGLIRSRMIGARISSSDILVYFDAHCEVQPNYLLPLITPIINNYKTCTCPLVDIIDGYHFGMSEQGGGDDDGFARGAFKWDFSWQRIPLTNREKNKSVYKTEPYRSPAMAGGLFAISRQYFFEIGMYDEDLEIWGAENYELSFKIWMCGGELLFVPCSRVGHTYRLEGWNGNPIPKQLDDDYANRNFKRIAEVWMDEYKQFFYDWRPECKDLEIGSLRRQKSLRRRLQCKSFEWYIQEIAYDIPIRFPTSIPDNGAEVRLHLWENEKSCIDTENLEQGDDLIFRLNCPDDVNPNYMLTLNVLKK